MWGRITALFMGKNESGSYLDHKKGPILEVTLENCIQQFDERLFPVIWFELRDVLGLLKKIEEMQQLMWELSRVCRHCGLNLTVSQNNRMLKMCEMMDNIISVPYPASFPEDYLDGTNAKLFLSSPTVISSSIDESSSVSFHLNCPDSDILYAYIAKQRSKLKLIEDMAASKKSDNMRFQFTKEVVISDGEVKTMHYLSSKMINYQVFDCNVVRNESKHFLAILEQLEIAMQQSQSIFQHLQIIKQKVYRPYIDLFVLFHQLPSLDDAEKALKDATTDYEQAETQYQEFRSRDTSLSNVTSLKLQLENVCKEIETFLSQYIDRVGFISSLSALPLSSSISSPSHSMITPVKITRSLSGNREEEMRHLLGFVTKVFARSAENIGSSTPLTDDSAIISDEDRDILRLLFLEPLLTSIQSFRKTPNNNINNHNKLTTETLAAIFMKRSVEEMEVLLTYFHKIFTEMLVQQSPISAVSLPYAAPAKSSDKQTIAKFSPTGQNSAANNSINSNSIYTSSPNIVDLLNTWIDIVPWDELLSLQGRLRSTQYALTEETESKAFADSLSTLQSLRAEAGQELVCCQRLLQRYRQLLSLHNNASGKLQRFAEVFVDAAWEEMQIQFQFVPIP